MKTCPACATENSDASQRRSAGCVPLEPATVKLAATIRVGSRSLVSASDSDSSVHGRFLPGTKIAGRYRIVSLGGRGGMGEVYRTDDLKLGHPVALKFLPRAVKEGSRSFQHSLSGVCPARLRFRTFAGFMTWPRWTASTSSRWNPSTAKT